MGRTQANRGAVTELLRRSAMLHHGKRPHGELQRAGSQLPAASCAARHSTHAPSRQRCASWQPSTQLPSRVAQARPLTHQSIFAAQSPASS